MKLDDIKILKSSRKGAAFIECEGKQVWIRPQAAKALGEGRIMPQVVKAIAEADVRDEEAKNKRPYRKVKPREYYSISEKAIVIKCNDGSEAVVPSSQVIDGVTHLLVADWIVKEKGLQAALKLIWV